MTDASLLYTKHGEAKLQGGTSSQLCLTGYDSGEILVFDQGCSDWKPVPLGPGGINQELFNGTATVNGSSGLSLAPNTLYSDYLTEDGAGWYKHSFWPTFQGFNPTIDGTGIWIGKNQDGSPNRGLTYLGQVWTGASNISTVIAPGAHLACPVYSHFNQWRFGFQALTGVFGSFGAGGFTNANNGLQTARISILHVTEGVSCTPEFSGHLDFANSVKGATFTGRISVSGTAINDAGGSTPWSSESPARYKAVHDPYWWDGFDFEWASAPPIGVYTATLDIAVDGGVSFASMSLLGKLAY